MHNKTVRRLLVAVVLLALLAAPLAIYGSRTTAQKAYDVPQILGMERDGGEVARLDGPPTYDISTPIVEVSDAPESMDISLKNLPQVAPEEQRPLREMGTPPDMAANEVLEDPVVQSGFTAEAAAPPPLKSFKGLTFSTNGSGWPPDTVGDVGPNHYIQAVNTSIGIFRKTDGKKLASFSFNSFFSAKGASGVCANSNQGDPVVLYDKFSKRWIITDFAWTNFYTGPYYECIAVSKTADPVNGGWWLYTLKAHNTQLNDYPKLGAWSDGIYMSANMFGIGSNTYNGVRVWALNRSDMISGKPMRSVSFALGTAYFSLLPANVKGANPPAGTPSYFLSDWGSNTRVRMWKFKVNWTNPSASTFTGPVNITVAGYTRPGIRIPQKGSSEKLDTIGDRLMANLQYRNISGTESLWAARTVVANGGMGVRWFEIRGMKTTPKVFQQGTYAPDSKYRWMPSLAVNKKGEMAIGYSVSSSAMYPEIRYAGRRSTDAKGVLGLSETTLIAGTGSQSGGYNRWGDYSAMTVDPADDCTFWYTTEYYQTTGSNWQTRIGSFRLTSCP